MEVDAPGPQQVSRSSIWFEDGNLVLQAGQIQFCVHRGVLARHSVVFRDMLSFPQDQGEHDMIENVEGHPLVHVSDTSADLGYLLQALYDQVGIIGGVLDVESVPRHCAVLRLSSKYMIAHLRQAASAVFLRAFPATHPTGGMRTNPVLLTYSLTLNHLSDIANALDASQLRSPLPVVLYCIAQRFKEKEDEIFLSPLHFDLKRAVFSQLSAQRMPLLAHLMAEYLALDECDDKEKCREAFESMWQFSCTSLTGVPPAEDQLFPDARRLFKDEVCNACRAELVALSEQYATDLWESLPGLYLAAHSWAALLDGDKHYQENLSGKA